MNLPPAALDETRAALAPTLEATAAILPWVTPRPPRFPPALAKRWQDACAALACAWPAPTASALRPAVFALYGVAIELNDADCLRLAESLAGAADAIETHDGHPRLVAALTAAVECLAEPGGLEHPAFPERARHFAARLERDARSPEGRSLRFPVLERLFADEAGECLERMREALLLLPPDAHAVKTAADEIRRQADALELDAVSEPAASLVRRIASRAGEHTDLDAGAARREVEGLIEAIERAVASL